MTRRIDWDTAKVSKASDTAYTLTVAVVGGPESQLAGIEDPWCKAAEAVVFDDEKTARHSPTGLVGLPPFYNFACDSDAMSAKFGDRGQIPEIRAYIDALAERADQQIEAERAAEEAARHQAEELAVHRERELDEMTQAFRDPKA